jgi:hypothetical protein
MRAEGEWLQGPREVGREGWAEMERWRRADPLSAAARRGGRAPPAAVPQAPGGGARRGCGTPPPARPGDHDETRPVSTGKGTRRVQLVREGGGGGDGPELHVSALHPSPGGHGALDPAARAWRGTHCARSSPGADPSPLAGGLHAGTRINFWPESQPAGGLRAGAAGQLERRIEELERRLGAAQAGAPAGGAAGAGGAGGGGAGYAEGEWLQGPREWRSPLCVPASRRARPAPQRAPRTASFCGGKREGAAQRRACPPPPPLLSRTNWTSLVPPPVLTGHGGGSGM